ncbi:MAG: hypothetical protein A2020_05715 [Lentisphaerae bacterium GWF2_45_14]|nr:MAG: hypothetical protein A2020_05715 [Lentisphaerae bacterium GWF2_45_14]
MDGIIEKLMDKTISLGASDLFICSGKAPSCRKSGELVKVSEDIINSADIDSFRVRILLPDFEKIYSEKGAWDSGFTGSSGQRFRINFYVSQGLPALAARPLPSASGLEFSNLNLPEAIKDFAEAKRGLILIAGSSGSGKSTTMSAIVNYINKNYARHVVSIEDPIEFIHNDLKSVISQREVGTDTYSFAEALRNVVRESPDVIVIGEMRDLDTMQTAVNAALTGHLVISTIHTADTIQSIERIINYYPDHLRQQASDDLSLALVGIIAQRLIPSKDGSLLPSCEILKATPLVRNLISSRNFGDLENVLRRGAEDGMTTFTRAISELCKSGKISIEAGAVAATNREELMLLVQGMESGIETFRDLFKDGDLGSGDSVNMKKLLHSAVSNKASDLIISAGCRPVLRVDGDLNELETEVLTASVTKKLLFSIVNQHQRVLFEDSRELDFALTVSLPLKSPDGNVSESVHRFRINAFYQRGNVSMAARVINQKIPSPESLGIPGPITEFADKKQGLVLVTGPTGHGKSTTLASLIDRINSRRSCHIITVEDPIEFVHENKLAVIEQREVHSDTLSFANSLKYVLRQDPDVILVGEMRDNETIAAALTAAETGHLVFATLHTNDAPQSIDRIVDSFPQHQQNQIRIQLAACVLGIVSQRLIPLKSGDGRVAVFEVLSGTSAVKALIREGKTHQIKSIMQTSSKSGMITMEKALGELYSKNIISRKDMMSYTHISDDPPPPPPTLESNPNQKSENS